MTFMIGQGKARAARDPVGATPGGIARVIASPANDGFGARIVVDLGSGRTESRRLLGAARRELAARFPLRPASLRCDGS
ncbi:hypothetical protein VSR82_19485 [Burkholderia sp. JPY481]